MYYSVEKPLSAPMEGGIPKCAKKRLSLGVLPQIYQPEDKASPFPSCKNKNSSKRAHLFSSQMHSQLKLRDLSSTPSFPFALSLGRAGHRKLPFPPSNGHAFLSLSVHSEDEGLAVIFTLYCLVNIVCAHTETSRPDTEPGYPHTCTKNFQGFVTSGSTYT